MHFAPTEDQRQLRQAVAELLSDACPPALVRGPFEGGPRDATLWPLLAETGVLGIDVPEDAGGMGMTACEWHGVLVEAGRHAAPGALVETVAAARWLADAGETALAADIATGEARVTLGTAGGLFVDADIADIVLVIDGPEVSRVEGATLSPVACTDLGTRQFRVEGGTPHPLAGDGQLLHDRAAVAAAAMLIGLGDRMLDMAVAYARERRQFGKAIGSFQAVQHLLVDALLELRFAGPTVAAAAYALAADLPEVQRRRDVATAKAMASEAAWLAGRQALQAHGAIGYTWEYDLHLYMKRAWVLSTAWGSAAAHREQLAHHLLDSDAVLSTVCPL